MKSLFESASVSSVIGVGEVVRLSGSLDGRILKLLCQILGVQCSAPHGCSKMHQENCYLQDKGNCLHPDDEIRFYHNSTQ